MNKIFTKKQILTIPNMISFFRFLLIPVILWLYLGAKNHIVAIIVILISGLSDVLDGIIARKFNMISDFGKLIDPIADKCTQGTLVICLCVQYPMMLLLLTLFILREINVSIMNCLTITKKKTVNSAKWYGKLNTVVIYSTIFLLIFVPNLINPIANVLIGASCFTVILSWIMYVRFFGRILSKSNTEK